MMGQHVVLDPHLNIWKLSVKIPNAISWELEKKMGGLNSIDNDMPQSEVPVVRTTEDILVRVSIRFTICVILHFVRENMIKEYGLKARCESNIFKFASTS